MEDQDVKLIDPTEDLREEFLGYIEEFRRLDEPFVHEQRDEALADFGKFIQHRRDWAAGGNLPEGRVPGSCYWLVRDRRIVATSRLRHQLNEALEDDGGHIGYEVRKSDRGKGYASVLLALTLAKAREVGLSRALLTCNQDNPASARVIEKNGGKLASEGISKRDGKSIRRYWIELAKPGDVGDT